MLDGGAATAGSGAIPAAGALSACLESAKTLAYMEISLHFQNLMRLLSPHLFLVMVVIFTPDLICNKDISEMHVH
jgi:hypothetical protein